jgi:hypothetical protein
VPTKVTLADGTEAWVPTGGDPGQYLLQSGVPVGNLPGVLPGAAPDDTYQMPGSGFLSDAVAGAGLYIGRRTPGIREHIANIKPPDTLGGTVGGMAVPVGASFAVPGAGLVGIGSQAALAGGLEAMDPDATPGSVMGASALAGGGTATFDLLGRALRGGVRAFQALRRSGVLANTNETLRTVANAAGGNVLVDRINRRALTRAAAQSFGQNADNLSPQVLDQAADQIGQQFDQVLGNLNADLTGVQAQLAQLPAGTIGARANRAIASVTDWANVDGSTLRAVRQALAERGRNLLGEAPASADDLLVLVDDIDNVAEQALGPQFRAQFRQAREAWKNLRIIESLPTVRKSGGVSAGELSQALAREGRGYGTSFIRDTGNVLPGTQRLFDVTRTLTADAAGRIGNPGTAPALAGTAGLGMAAGVLTGATAPATALAGLGAAGLAQAAGLAAVGGQAPTMGRAGAAAAQEASRWLERNE